MADLGGILALPAILITVGVLFAAQYKLSVKERKWTMLIIPGLILVAFLVCSALLYLANQNPKVTVDLVGEDGHGNILKLTIVVPQKGDQITRFSNLMIYNKDQVLVDDIYLYYSNNKPEMERSLLVYNKYIQQMLKRQIRSVVKLDGSSWDRELVTDGTPFMGGTIMTGDIFKFLVFLFGIPFFLTLFAGILPRYLNRKKIRARAMAKVDIQSLDNGE